MSLNLVQATKVLSENNIAFTTTPVMSNGFYGTAVIFETKRIATKAAKVIDINTPNRRPFEETRIMKVLDGSKNFSINYFG